MKIYTRTGDSGESGLIGGERALKCDPRFMAIGDVDELNAAVGASVIAAPAESPFNHLARIQNQLFDLGAEIAASGDARFLAMSLDPGTLESQIDAMTEELPPLKNFILPGGSELSARLHLARAICRRAERSLVALREADGLRPEPIIFLNRLSDWLFSLARLANHRVGNPDILWNRS